MDLFLLSWVNPPLFRIKKKNQTRRKCKAEQCDSLWEIQRYISTKTLNKSWHSVQVARNIPLLSTTIKIYNRIYCWGNSSGSQAKRQELTQTPVHFWILWNARRGSLVPEYLVVKPLPISVWLWASSYLCICDMQSVMRNSVWHTYAPCVCCPHTWRSQHMQPPQRPQREKEGLWLWTVRQFGDDLLQNYACLGLCRWERRIIFLFLGLPKMGTYLEEMLLVLFFLPKKLIPEWMDRHRVLSSSFTFYIWITWPIPSLYLFFVFFFCSKIKDEPMTCERGRWQACMPPHRVSCIIASTTAPDAGHYWDPQGGGDHMLKLFIWKFRPCLLNLQREQQYFIRVHALVRPLAKQGLAGCVLLHPTSGIN